LSDAPSGATAFLMLGISSTTWQGITLPLSLAPFGFPMCSLYTSIEIARPVVAGSDGIRRGYAECTLPLPLTTGVPQFTVNGQWMVLGNGAFVPGGVSGGLAWQY
jgi:hypothetical protein